jgi:hypothetical protein
MYVQRDERAIQLWPKGNPGALDHPQALAQKQHSERQAAKSDVQMLAVSPQAAPCSVSIKVLPRRP